MDSVDDAAFRTVQRRCVVIARTGDVLRSFTPYVAAMRDDGAALVQAQHTDGATGVHVLHPGDAPPEFIPAPNGSAVVSHPDSGSAGSACFYADSPGDGVGLWLSSDRGCTRLATACGPLGPTMDDQGWIAFRTVGPQGQAVWVWDGRRARMIDESEPGTPGFEGLPVVAAGRVTWRVTRADGTHAIRIWDRGVVATIATTGDEHSSLARFPTMNRAGFVVYSATSTAGADGLFVWHQGQTRQVAAGPGRFESIRGGLITDRGTLLLIGTPCGGRPGVFADALGEHPIVQVGTALDGALVEEFAVNPVSVNGSDQVAIRATLADGRQVVARSDPI